MLSQTRLNAFVQLISGYANLLTSKAVNWQTRLENHFILQKTLAFGRMMTTENQR